MQEKVLSSKKNGMAMMILFILLYVAATVFQWLQSDSSGYLWDGFHFLD